MRLIAIVVILLSTLSVSFGQTKMDSWFKFKNESVEGYLHYKVEEDSMFTTTFVDSKFKRGDGVMCYAAIIKNKKDSLMTVESFEITGTTDDIHNPQQIKFAGHLRSKEDAQVWTAKVNDGNALEIETQYPTIANWNLFYLMTLLDYSKTGRILEFNSMELPELNYKKNHYLEYLEDEEILINGNKIQARKITHNGDRSGESTYWLDMNNKLVKISIDNRKNFEKCKKEDIELDKYKITTKD